MFTLIILYFLLATVSSQHEYNETVEYYTNLIQEGVHRSQSWQAPTNADEYKPASRAGPVINIGSFDYIVVGGGSSGAVVASRLSEVPNLQILLVEAGDYGNDFTDIPAMGDYSRYVGYDWGFRSTPQSTICLERPERRCTCPRGKGVGGSSIINGMIYARGNRADYDGWAQKGNPSWSYNNVLQTFKKSENSTIEGDKGFHGRGGNMKIEYYKPKSVMSQAFIDANIELGRNFIDYNGKHQLGVGWTQFTKNNGRRVSTGKAYIYPALNRTNLKIITNSYVTKIVINAFNIATGITFSNKSGYYKAHAKKEVIISAGTISSPHLLMNSGVGPSLELLKHFIPVKKNLPVGHNFMDHVILLLQFSTNFTRGTKTLEEDVQSYLDGLGPLTANNIGTNLAFLQTNLSKIDGKPDIEIIMVPEEKVQIPIHNTERNSIYMLLILLNIKSKGMIKLRSRSPFDYPLIDSDQLSDNRNLDIETMFAGVQLILQLLQTQAFQKHNVSLIRPNTFACNHLAYLSKQYWICILRQLAGPGHHSVGTCAMGSHPLKGAVVDNFLRIHGVKHLRVADASVIPFPTSGHTQAPAVMIGEMASEFILQHRQ